MDDNTMFYELSARYDARKSFYGKAHVIERDDCKTLISYETPVMRISGSTIFRADGQPESNTTSRHMCEFARQNGFPPMSKKALMELEVDPTL